MKCRGGAKCVLVLSLVVAGALQFARAAQAKQLSYSDLLLKDQDPIGQIIAEQNDSGLVINPVTAPSATPDNPFPTATTPSWQYDRLAQSDQVDYHHDLRKNTKNGDDFDTYKLNEDGVIDGSDLLGLIQPMSYQQFRQQLAFSGGGAAPSADPQKLYTKYLGDAANQGMAVLALNRIIDREAMKKKLPPHVSDERVDYVMRSILVENAIQSGKVPTHLESVDPFAEKSAATSVAVADSCTAAPAQPAAAQPATRKVPDEDLSVRSNEELYGWLKETIINSVQDHVLSPAASVAGAPAKARVLGSDVTSLQVRLSGDFSVKSVAVKLRAPVEAGKPAGAPVVLTHAIGQRLSGQNTLDVAQLLGLGAQYNGYELVSVTLSAGAWYGSSAQLLVNGAQTDTSAKIAGSVRFNIGWHYDLGGLELDREQLDRDESNLQWSDVHLAFQALPDSWQEFRDQIRTQLEPVHRNVIRMTAWRALVAERYPDFVWTEMFSMTTDQLQRYYDALKDQAFKVQDSDADVSELVVSGAKAKDFDERLESVFADKENSLLSELMGQPPAPGTSQDEQDRQLREKIIALRKTLPTQLEQQVLAEFAADIAAGNLKVTATDSTMHLTGGTQTPQDDSIPSQELRTVFNPAFSLMSVLPRATFKDYCGNLRVVLLRATSTSNPRYLSMDDDYVMQVLRAKIQAKHQGLLFRDFVYEMLRKNTFSKQSDTCSDPAWPCFTLDPRAMTMTLLPETLFPGASLGLDGPNRPVTDTLGRPELYGNVMDIDLGLFEKAFEVPNDHP